MPESDIVQKSLDRNIANGMTPSEAFVETQRQLQRICKLPWDRLHLIGNQVVIINFVSDSDSCKAD